MVSSPTDMSSRGEMKMSLRLITYDGTSRLSEPSPDGRGCTTTYVFMSKMLEQFQLAIGPLRQHRGAEGFDDLLDGDGGAGQLIAGRAARGPKDMPSAPRRLAAIVMSPGRSDGAYQTRPKAPMPTGWRSVYLYVDDRREHHRPLSPSPHGRGSPYLLVISKTVPNIWARTKSAMATGRRRGERPAR